MRWPVKPENPIKRRFAIFPVEIDNEWTWLEIYYVYEELGPGLNLCVSRFHTKQEALTWLNNYNNF